ncbi:MAG: bacterioferritin-associated ferredoxin [Kangiellaceae bacterium]|jgi:bacterioferritin-associated ferredoxin|nr:bacterioferritin-associated ferredoxin [Kangiellaceae bacterium]
MYVCLCKGITDSQIKQAIAKGEVNSFKGLNRQLGVATDCGKCGELAMQIVKQNLATDLTITNAA